MSEKRPSARPLYRDIFEYFYGDTDLLGFYNLILAKVCWGDFTVYSKRKSHLAHAEELITTMSELTKWTKKSHRTIKRYIAILVEMGVITFEERSKQCLVITNTNIVIKTAEEASKMFPKERRDIKRTKSGPRTNLEDDTESGPRTNFNVDHGPDSDVRKWSTDQIGSIPSSVLKEEDLLKEELLKEEGNPGEVVLDKLNSDFEEIIEAYKANFLLNVKHIQPFFEAYKNSGKTKEEMLKTIKIAVSNPGIKATTISPLRLFEINRYALPMVQEIERRAIKAINSFGERRLAINSLLCDPLFHSFFSTEERIITYLNELWDNTYRECGEG